SLIQALGGAMDKEIATCLFTSIYTDTGGFRYSNTDEAVLKTTAELMKYKVEPHVVCNGLYEQNTLGQIRLLGLTLETLQSQAGGKIAWVETTQEMMQKTGTGEEDTEGFVN